MNWECARQSHKQRTQTTEGIPIRRASQAYARNCSGLAQQELEVAVEEMAQNLVAMMSAETLDSYTGPVLFEHQAAAQLVAQALSGRLADTPKPISDASGFNPFASMENPFQNRIDSRVFPRSMSVINDPTIKEFNGKSLLGSYDVDSEGMPARRTELISNGILKALLATSCSDQVLRKYHREQQGNRRSRAWKSVHRVQ